MDGFYLHNIEYTARTSSGASPDWTKAYEILNEIDSDIIEYKNTTGDANKQL